MSAASNIGDDVPAAVANPDFAVDRFVYWFFAIEITLFFVLQKLGIPMGGGLVANSALPLMYIGLVYAFLKGRATVDPIRFVLYLGFAGTAVISHLFVRSGFSMPSLMMVILIYLPLVAELKVSRATYLGCIGFYQKLAVVFAAFVLLQNLIQFTIGWRYWINLNEIIPEPFQFKFYMYIQPLHWGSPYMKPNAFFFLEVSVLSQFLASALIIEIIYFQKLWRMILFAGALLLTFAGTGLLMLAVCLPFLALRASPRLLFAGLLAGLVTIGFAWSIGWLGEVSHRFGEHNRAGSSAFQRFVLPGERLVEQLERPESIYSGIGAGEIQQAMNFVWWPLTKVTVEYGVLCAVCFFAFLFYVLFVGTPSRRLFIGMFVSFNFLNGSFAVPLFVYWIFMLCGLMRLNTEGEKTGAAASWPLAAYFPRAQSSPSSPSGTRMDAAGAHTV